MARTLSTHRGAWPGVVVDKTGGVGLRSRRARRRRPSAEVTTWLAIGLAVALALAYTTHLRADHKGVPRRADGPARTSRPTASTAAARPPSTTAAVTDAASVPAPGTGRSGRETTRPTPTTTSTTTSTTTPSRSHAAAAPQIVAASQSWHGTLVYPGDVATTVSFPVSAGAVTVSAITASASELRVSVACAGGSGRRRGRGDVSVTVAASAGLCSVTVANPAPQTVPRLTYTLVASYLVTQGASPP